MLKTSGFGTWRGAATLLLALSAAVITACGGGGDSGGTTSAATEKATAYAAGPISGFGSVIINGVRYDDSRAVVTDDDDRARARDLLRLGMMVEVDAKALNAAAGTGEALRIRYGSEIVGPVDAAPTATGLVVLGQTVTITDATVFDSGLTGGLAAIKQGDVLEIHAQFDAATQAYRATRIESAAGATTYKLRGTVANLNTMAKTFTLGGQVVNYGGIASDDLPPNLADGLRVRVRLQTTQVNGEWVATAVRTGIRKVEDRPDGDVRGAITVFKSATDFEINGLKVNASNASFPDGNAGIVLGAMVEVEGAIVDGILVATKVELEGAHTMDMRGFELHGLISGLDTSAKSFMLRGIKVNYGGAAVVWKGGVAADLADGKQVEVKGMPSMDRTQLVATLVQFEN